MKSNHEMRITGDLRATRLKQIANGAIEEGLSSREGIQLMRQFNDLFCTPPLTDAEFTAVLHAWLGMPKPEPRNTKPQPVPAKPQPVATTTPPVPLRPQPVAAPPQPLVATPPAVTAKPDLSTIKPLVMSSKLDVALPQTELEELAIVPFSSLSGQPVTWLWPGRIPLRKVTVITGEAGLGMSLLTLDIAARVSGGIGWPDAAQNSPGRVILLNADDHLADSVGPSLDAAGAVRQRILAVQGLRPTPPSFDSPSLQGHLVDYLWTLGEEMREMGDVRLVIIDPLAAFCGRIGRHPTETTRSIGAALSKLAADYNVAVLAITDERNAGLPARISWRVQRDPFDPDLRIWSPDQFHYGPRPSSLGYRIQGNRIAWEPTPVSLTAEELGAARPLKHVRLRQEVIGEWLLKLLRSGVRDSKEIYTAGEAVGLSAKQLWRAKSVLNVQVTKVPEQWGKWTWELPQEAAKPSAAGR